ncbi:MAG: hypothetical protein L3J32_03485 [Rhizobiaceae bacterium]|nr:hypothetical protein [Rhizobiaceae bacterium]
MALYLKTGLFLTVSLLLALILINLAQATPPRYVSLNDTPVAANKTHLFLFRNLSDNQGSYYTSAITRFLISQNLKTGKVEDHWPLGSTYEETVEECLSDCLKSSLDNIINPFELFSEKQAAPVLLSPKTDWNKEYKFPVLSTEYFLTEQGLMKKNDDNSITNILPVSFVLQRISSSLDPTMEIMPDDNSRVDPLEFSEESYYKNISGCLVQPYFANIGKFSLFSLTCEGEGDDQINSYRIFLTLNTSK